MNAKEATRVPPARWWTTCASPRLVSTRQCVSGQPEVISPAIACLGTRESTAKRMSTIAIRIRVRTELNVPMTLTDSSAIVPSDFAASGVTSRSSVRNPLKKHPKELSTGPPLNSARRVGYLALTPQPHLFRQTLRGRKDPHRLKDTEK